MEMSTSSRNESARDENGGKRGARFQLEQGGVMVTKVEDLPFCQQAQVTTSQLDACQIGTIWSICLRFWSQHGIRVSSCR